MDSLQESNQQEKQQQQKQLELELQLKKQKQLQHLEQDYESQNGNSINLENDTNNKSQNENGEIPHQLPENIRFNKNPKKRRFFLSRRIFPEPSKNPYLNPNLSLTEKIEKILSVFSYENINDVNFNEELNFIADNFFTTIAYDYDKDKNINNAYKIISITNEYAIFLKAYEKPNSNDIYIGKLNGDVIEDAFILFKANLFKQLIYAIKFESKINDNEATEKIKANEITEKIIETYLHKIKINISEDDAKKNNVKTYKEVGFINYLIGFLTANIDNHRANGISSFKNLKEQINFEAIENFIIENFSGNKLKDIEAENINYQSKILQSFKQSKIKENPKFKEIIIPNKKYVKPYVFRNNNVIDVADNITLKDNNNENIDDNKLNGRSKEELKYFKASVEEQKLSKFKYEIDSVLNKFIKIDRKNQYKHIEETRQTLNQLVNQNKDLLNDLIYQSKYDSLKNTEIKLLAALNPLSDKKIDNIHSFGYLEKLIQLHIDSCKQKHPEHKDFFDSLIKFNINFEKIPDTYEDCESISELILKRTLQTRNCLYLDPKYEDKETDLINAIISQFMVKDYKNAGVNISKLINLFNKKRLNNSELKALLDEIRFNGPKLDDNPENPKNNEDDSIIEFQADSEDFIVLPEEGGIGELQEFPKNKINNFGKDYHLNKPEDNVNLANNIQPDPDSSLEEDEDEFLDEGTVNPIYPSRQNNNATNRGSNHIRIHLQHPRLRQKNIPNIIPDSNDIQIFNNPPDISISIDSNNDNIIPPHNSPRQQIRRGPGFNNNQPSQQPSPQPSQHQSQIHQLRRKRKPIFQDIPISYPFVTPLIHNSDNTDISRENAELARTDIGFIENLLNKISPNQQSFKLEKPIDRNILPGHIINRTEIDYGLIINKNYKFDLSEIKLLPDKLSEDQKNVFLGLLKDINSGNIDVFDRLVKIFENFKNEYELLNFSKLGGHYTSLILHNITNSNTDNLRNPDSQSRKDAIKFLLICLYYIYYLYSGRQNLGHLLKPDKKLQQLTQSQIIQPKTHIQIQSARHTYTKENSLPNYLNEISKMSLAFIKQSNNKEEKLSNLNDYLNGIYENLNLLNPLNHLGKNTNIPNFDYHTRRNTNNNKIDFFNSYKYPINFETALNNLNTMLNSIANIGSRNNSPIISKESLDGFKTSLPNDASDFEGLDILIYPALINLIKLAKQDNLTATSLVDHITKQQIHKSIYYTCLNFIYKSYSDSDIFDKIHNKKMENEPNINLFEIIFSIISKLMQTISFMTQVETGENRNEETSRKALTYMNKLNKLINELTSENSIYFNKWFNYFNCKESKNISKNEQISSNTIDLIEDLMNLDKEVSSTYNNAYNKRYSRMPNLFSNKFLENLYFSDIANIFGNQQIILQIAEYILKNFKIKNGQAKKSEFSFFNNLDEERAKFLINNSINYLEFYKIISNKILRYNPTSKNEYGKRQTVDEKQISLIIDFFTKQLNSMYPYGLNSNYKPDNNKLSQISDPNPRLTTSALPTK
ncbi:MAG: hypothetical protein N4A49_08295 [Marinifilaceae bacterium]|jgi:hypothetical protein|nr:hypothetical protein [Marinifilaceae bacterium]